MTNRKIYSLVLLVFAWVFFTPCYGGILLPSHNLSVIDHSRVIISNSISGHSCHPNIDLQRNDNHKIISPIRTKALDNAFAAILPSAVSLCPVYADAIAINHSGYTCRIILHSCGSGLLRGPPQA